MTRYGPRWLRSLLLGALAGAVVVAGATLATLGVAPFASFQQRIVSFAADLRWSSLAPERLDRLRDTALEAALHNREKWLRVEHQQAALPLVCDEVYSRSVPSVDGAMFELITEGELQSRANAAGVYWVYHVGAPDFTWAKATVWVSYRQHFAQNSDLLDLGSRAVKLECVPVSSRWQCTVLTWVIA